MKKLYVAILIASIGVLPGCAHRMRTWNGYLKPKAFMQLSLGMKKQEVIQQIGAPDIARGSITNKFGQVIELWEYKVNDILSPVIFAESYWLYFHNNKLARWSKAGDWEKESDHIQEIRFR